jgi:hypothetical protein
MKKCNKCLIIKDFSDFNKHKTQKDGLNITCRECCKIANKKRYELKKNEIKQRVKQYKNNNKEKVNIKATEWRNSRLQKERDRRKKWRQSNLSIVKELTAKRRAIKKQATLDYQKYKKHLRDIYKNCPDGMEVDHIIPLQNNLVCGLHVPWNLQYLTPEENVKKSNKLCLNIK